MKTAGLKFHDFSTVAPNLIFHLVQHADYIGFIDTLLVACGKNFGSLDPEPPIDGLEVFKVDHPGDHRDQADYHGVFLSHVGF